MRGQRSETRGSARGAEGRARGDGRDARGVEARGARGTVMATSPPPLVLVVDDEPAIREMERRILEKRGYRVLEAPGGAEGVEMLKAGKPIDLLIADLDMPS